MHGCRHARLLFSVPQEQMNGGPRAHARMQARKTFVQCAARANEWRATRACTDAGGALRALHAALHGPGAMNAMYVRGV
jgi:hypothetical protein